MAELAQVIAALRDLATQPRAVAPILPQVQQLATVIAKQTGASMVVREEGLGKVTVIFSGRNASGAAGLLRSRVQAASEELGSAVAADIAQGLEAT